MATAKRPALDAGLAWAADVERVRLIGEAAVGLSQLVFRGGAEIAALAAEVHAAIAGGAPPLAADVRPDASQAPYPYRIVRDSFTLLAILASALPQGAEHSAPPDLWRRFVGALNGVVGDRLAAWNNTLAIRTGVRGVDGTPLAPARLPDQVRRGAVVFVHGLCASDVQWHTPAHDALVSDLEQAGYSVGWLRYNSGRAIWQSGRELAELLEADFGSAGDLVLIGHSMGGLVVRSACHSAAAGGHGWLGRLTHAAYLGSPHRGAPLERVGSLANSLLAWSPYSAPFMRLGNVRSRGIKDLGFACLTQDESSETFGAARRSIVPLPEQVRHLFVAGSLQGPPGGRWLGDGLVSVASALGFDGDNALSLTAPHLERVHIYPLGHIALMNDERTCETLRTWVLGGPGGDATASSG
jgi:hypothetical protein